MTNQTRTVLNVPLVATVPAGTTELIMESYPNGRAPVNHSFFIGSNAAAQTGPSYMTWVDLRDYDADQCFGHWLPGHAPRV